MNKHVCETHRAEIEESAADSRQSLALREHLAACAPCEQFRRERASLRLLVGGLGKVAAPADFEFRLRARMASSGGASRAKRSRFGFVPGLASVALAVCFVSVSAWVYFKRGPATNAPGAPARASVAAPAAVPVNTPMKDVVSDVVVEKVSGGSDEHATYTASHKTAKARGASTLRARLNGKGSDRPEGMTGNAAVFDSQPAPILNSSSVKPSELASLPTTAVAVRTPAVALQVILRDETGATRVVPMRSVSFGSQELVRQGRSTVPASYTDKEGVW